MSTFAERLEFVRTAIAGACRKAGRNVADVTIVTVTKTFGPDAVLEAAGCGMEIFGESKVQEAKQKMPLCHGVNQWHMIGHLQTNKCKDAVRLFKMIHSVDSLRLLEAIDSDSGKAGLDMPVCIEVNVSGERSKFGMKPEDVPALLQRSQQLMHVSVVGLLTIPPFSPEKEDARPFFRKLRELRDGWRRDAGVALDTLSMGMSNDFEVAIEEGATMIRLGSVLLGERPKAKFTPALDF